METRKILTILVLALGAMVCMAVVSEEVPTGSEQGPVPSDQGQVPSDRELVGHCEVTPERTAFTYRGQLLDVTSFPDGYYDFRFRLFDDANVIDGYQVGSDVIKTDVEVVDGCFTVELDFGDVFDGNDRWLEIAMRLGAYSSSEEYSEEYIALVPWQEVGTVNYIPKYITTTTFGNSVIYQSGNNIGIGTTSPSSHRLYVKNYEEGYAAVRGTDEIYSWLYAEGQLGVLAPTGLPYNPVNIGVLGIKHDVGSEGVAVYGWNNDDNIQNYAMYAVCDGSGTGTNYGIYAKAENAGTNYAGYFEGGKNYFEGKIGIGTTNPQGLLHLANVFPVAILQDDNSKGAKLTSYISFRDSASAEKAWFGYGSTSNANFTIRNTLGNIILNPSGKVGIGTGNPKGLLHLASAIPIAILQDNDSKGAKLTSYISFRNSSAVQRAWVGYGSSGNTRFTIRNALGDIILNPSGKVGIGTSSPAAKLDVAGTTRTRVLEITGGSDLAEPFEINGADSIESGMVVCIDAEHPGQLRVSSKAYDRTVAGVISGAKGIKAGLTMRQEGTEANGAHPVALTGRVYCLCDASSGRINPGDLLTTSDTAGHAMKVTDYVRASGTILGKAMSRLEHGKGLVLVLVSLQ